MRSEPGWPDALERAAAARIVLLLGDTDSGKTSLATYLGGALASRGLAVGVVDADIGQSHVGPPGTVGLGRLWGPVESLAEAETLALHWVGRMSPPGVERELWAGTGLLAGRGVAAGLRPILIDTCGLVRGALGRYIVTGTVAEAQADLVICLQRDRECGAILDAIESRSGSRALTLPVGPGARRRSPQERRRHREAGLDRYFAAARARAVPLAALGPDAGDASRDDLADRLVGLLDERGATVGIGRITGVDATAATLLIDTPVVHSPIHRVVPGRDVYRPAMTPEVIP